MKKRPTNKPQRPVKPVYGPKPVPWHCRNFAAALVDAARVAERLSDSENRV